MKRIEFNRATRRAIIDRACGRCEVCNAVLKTGEGEVDHILPAELGGEATQANGRLLCKVCHKSKTACDIRRIRKADRQRDRHTGAMMPTKNPLRGRGFPKKPKRRVEQLPLPPRRWLTPIGGMDAVSASIPEDLD